MAQATFSDPAVETPPAEEAKPATVTVGGSPDTATTAVVGDTPVTQVAVREPRAPAAVEETFIEDDDFEGELDANDMVIPYLSLVHAVSEIADQFDPGSFVLGKEVQLGAKGATFDIIVCRASKSYKELLSKDNPDEPRTFQKAVDVVNAGGQTHTYGEDIGYFGGLGDFLILVKKPAGLPESPAFPYRIAGESYALAKYTAFKSAYTGFAKPIFNLKLKKDEKGRSTPIKGTAWKLSSQFKKRGENAYWSPKVIQTPTDQVAPEILEFIDALPA